MSPGLWNETNYEASELRKAYISTDWGNAHATSLFLDHPENPNNAAGDWIGKVKNPRQLEDSTIIGDIEIWDQDTAFKMEVAKAGFGVSPRVLGKLDKSTNSFVDFIFDNFSIVSKPAQDTATINLNKEIFSESLTVRQLSTDDLASHPKKKNSKKMKGGKREMSTEELQHHMEDFQKQVFDLSVQAVTEKIQNTWAKVNARREIARSKTIIRERQMAQAAVAE